MYDYANIREIEGPDGTVITFNDDAGLVLEEISGFDSPQVRTNYEDRPEEDGAVAGDFFYGARSATLRGTIVGLSASERNAAASNIQRACRALRDDLTVRAEPAGMPAMQAVGRLDGPPRITGTFVKQFFIPLVFPDPRLYSQTLHSDAGGTTPILGAAFDWAFPVNFGGGTGASASVQIVNAGNFDTPPVITVTGPMSEDWRVERGDSGESIYVDDLALAAGQYVVLDVGERTATRWDGVNIYDMVRFPDSRWWQLPPGATTVKLWANGTGAETEVGVEWRDAWA